MKTSSCPGPAAHPAEPVSADPYPHSGFPDVAARAIIAAGARLRGIVRMTPCIATRSLVRDDGAAGVWLKREDRQVTGSFKERGAANALLGLTRTERARGVVAASAGNHALGLAWHGGRTGVPVTLVMPEQAARVKVARCRALGARVVLAGETFGDAETFARTLAQRGGAVFVHPFDDPAVIAGQGTIGLEVLRQLPALGTVVVPVGGGGLLAGVATIVKHLRPDVRVIAVEPAASPKLSRAWASGAPAVIGLQPSLADGLAVSQLGSRAFGAAMSCVDAVVTVTEAEIARAMLRLFEEERIVVEGAGAVALAGVVSGRIENVNDRPVVAIVSGANVDARTFARALDRAAEPMVL